MRAAPCCDMTSVFHRCCAFDTSTYRAFGVRLTSVIIINAFALTLPLVSIDLLTVRTIGLENRPEELNTLNAVQFAPSMCSALFGLLTDTVQLRCFQPSRHSRQARRAPWIVLGLVGNAAALVPIACDSITSLGWLYAAVLPAAICATLTAASIDGVLVQIGRSIAADSASAVDGTKARSAVMAIDYQLRGLGSLLGYLVSASLPSTATVTGSAAAATAAAAACYLLAAVMAGGLGRGDALDEAEHLTRASDSQQPTAHSETTTQATTHLLRSSPGFGAVAVQRAREISREIWAQLGGLPTLCCLGIAFIYQLSPTPDDTYSAFVFSRELHLSSALLSLSGALSLIVGMIGAAAIFQQLALPPLTAFALGAFSRAVGNLALLPLALQSGPPSKVLYMAQIGVSSLFNGLAFLPIIALGALAAPRGREASVFGLVMTAQSAGTLLGAMLAGRLCAAMDVGSADGRSWQPLPAFILICSALKLAVLLPCLPLLYCVRKANDARLTDSSTAHVNGPLQPEQTCAPEAVGGGYSPPSLSCA